MVEPGAEPEPAESWPPVLTAFDTPKNKYAIDVEYSPPATTSRHLTRITMPLGAPCPHEGDNLEIDSRSYIVRHVTYVFDPKDDTKSSFLFTVYLLVR